MTAEQILEELIKANKLDIKDVDSIAKKKENDEEPKKIKLSPLSFTKVSKFFTKCRFALLSNNLSKKQTELAGLQKEVASSTMSEKDVERVALKIAKLEEKINVLEYKKRSYSSLLGRALKVKQNMLSNMVYHSDNLYKFEKNPFDKEVTVENNGQTNMSISDQLDKTMAESDNSLLEEPKTSLTIDEQLNNNLSVEQKPSISIGEQLTQVLNNDQMVENENVETSHVDLMAYQTAKQNRNKKVEPENIDSYLSNPNTYHLKKDEIVQDYLKTSPLGLPAHETEKTVPSTPTTFDDSLKYSSLEKDKSQLEAALSSLSSSSQDDYIRREYQQDLDKVLEEMANKKVSVNVESLSLNDLIKNAEIEEQKAQEIADLARLAREDAVQAAREKDEKERLSAEADERYGRLLKEAKEVIEERSLRARTRMAQEQAELDKNKSLAEGIRKDSQAIDAKVAERQRDISQLEVVLSQYRETPAASRGPLK